MGTWRAASVMTIVLAGALVAPIASLAASAPADRFVDDNGSVHESNIEVLADAGITLGCNPPTNDRFCPGDFVTREGVAAFISRGLDLQPAAQDFFTDDEDSPFQADINSLAAAGITRGCNPPINDQFCPGMSLTREQLAALLVRALGYTTVEGPPFRDTASSIFREDIDRLATAGVTLGCNPPANDLFCPKAQVTRGQIASFLTRALELDQVDLAPRQPTLEVVAREDWGAQPADTSNMTPHRIDTLTVHHAGDQTATTGPTRYRSWQAFHMSRGWGDLAYHYIIGVDGTVYEARDTAYRGDTGTNYDPTGHFLVVVEGNFETDIPTEAQLQSLVTTLAWASTEFGVSPSTISGHRDHAATACPGGNLYPYIASGDLEDDVRSALG